MIKEKKMIPCRVCGKMFIPCSYCQEHMDIFRWRNFACSKECAVEYIEKATNYRENNKQNISASEKENDSDNISEIPIKKRKRNSRKVISQENTICDEIEKGDVFE